MAARHSWSQPIDMNNVVYVRPTYTFKSQSALEAEAAAAKQTSVTVAEAPPPADLDTLLTELDAELEKLDSLVTKEREIPGNITRIDDRLRELEGQDLSTLEALEARSAQASKLANMKHLAEVQAKKSSAAIGTQTKVVIEIDTRTASELESFSGTFTKRRLPKPRLNLIACFFAPTNGRRC